MTSDGSAPKAVVLAAGRGTRMRAESPGAALDADQRRMADQGLKSLIPFHGHPYLSYSLSALADAGIREACLVVAPGENAIRDHYERLATSRLRLEFAVQERPLGTAHALLAAERFVGSDACLVIAADNYYPAAALAALRSLDGAGMAGFRSEVLSGEGNIPPERVAAFGLVSAGPGGCLSEIVEKPGPAEIARFAGSGYVSMTCWRFQPSVFAAAREAPPSARGEHELPDAVTKLVQWGECVRVVPVSVPVLDLSSRADVAAVGAWLRDVEVRL